MQKMNKAEKTDKTDKAGREPGERIRPQKALFSENTTLKELSGIIDDNAMRSGLIVADVFKTLTKAMVALPDMELNTKLMFISVDDYGIRVCIHRPHSQHEYSRDGDNGDGDNNDGDNGDNNDDDCFDYFDDVNDGDYDEMNDINEFDSDDEEGMIYDER